MKLFGLIGYPVEHSFSKKYFTEKFLKENITGCSFENFPLEDISELTSILSANTDLKGLSVTIPYKELVIPFLDELDETAKEIGAVNSVKISSSNGKQTTKGFNTDAYGFMHAIMNLLLPFHTSALILGTGGGSKAVAYGLKKMGLELDFVSRNPDSKELRYEDLNKDVIHHYKVIVNTTPLGMFPHTEEAPPIPYEYLTSSHLLFDLIYNPPQTLFLKQGHEQGALIENGFRMLQLQAEESWRIWNQPG